MSDARTMQLRYAELCRELGHLHSNKAKVDKRIAEIESEIAALDRLVEIPKKPQAVPEPQK